MSIGGLLHGLELDNLMMGVSVCRNPHLANVFDRNSWYSKKADALHLRKASAFCVRMRVSG